MGLLSSIVEGIGKAVNVLKSGTLFSTLTPGLKETKVAKAGAAGNVAINKATGTAVLVAAGTAAAISVAPPIVLTKVGEVVKGIGASVAKKVIDKPIKSAILGTVVAGAVAGGGADLIPGFVEKTFQAGKVAAEVATGEKPLTSENVGDVLKAAGVALGVGAVGVGAGLIAEKVMAAKEPDTSPISNLPEVPYEKAYSGAVGEQIPRETINIATKKRKGKARKKDFGGVKQSVKILINNRAVGSVINNRSYLKKRLYV
jgi:hypothetical protein